MKSLVVYDSQFGNTEKIARAVAETLAQKGSCLAVHVNDVQPDDLAGIEILAVGSPTQQLSATSAVIDWLDELPSRTLEGTKAAAFDTRFTQQKINEVKILAFFVNIFGYGAKPIARRLAKKGAELIAEPTGFYVSDTEGPLLEQELQRAAEWAAGLGTGSL